MTKTVTYNGYKINYEEIREQRKTFSLTVYPANSVLFKIPIEASEEESRLFLTKKVPWIIKQQDFFKQFKPKIQSWISGSDILYLGRRYQLIVKKSNKEKISFAGNKITAYCKDNAELFIKKFLLFKAEIIFNECLENCLKLFVNYPILKPKIKIRKMNKRWGSFFKNGTIMLNEELIKAPKRCIEYVILHELCHQYHKNHNKKFFTLLSQKCPKYKILKQELEFKLLS